MNKKMEALLSLQKYLLRASLMRDQFNKEVNKLSIPINKQILANFRIYHHDLCTYLDYWFSGLFCVLEGYQKLQIYIPEVDWITTCFPNLLPYLKNYRDSTYHFEIYRYKKISKYEGIGYLSSIELIHRALEEYLSLTLKGFSASSLLNKPTISSRRNAPQVSYKTLWPINNDGSDNFIFLVEYCLMDYWKKANLFKNHFYESLTDYKSSNDCIAIEPGTYMDYWCATLNIVIEGYERLGHKYSEIDRLLQSANPSYLRDYRNATFNYHKKYFNIHLIYNFITHKNLLEWLNTLHEAFTFYFCSKAEEFIYE